MLTEADWLQIRKQYRHLEGKGKHDKAYGEYRQSDQQSDKTIKKHTNTLCIQNNPQLTFLDISKR